MAEIDIEKLPVDLHGIALANGLPSGFMEHPAFGAFLRECKQALAALVLEEAGLVCDNLGTRAGTADQCADALRTIAEGLKP